ncbi:hypothetical protein HGRIS_011521 [Hohenbuehelia grisea]|uniref:F-box domain-containing protein n=1 Tax=Hohenbuehelia grisea TaxID=104357 RepID=A0ABR3JXD8_9AGAR
MPVRLPKELQSFVLDHLAGDREALWNLCLAGNRDLFTAALPRTWQDVSFTVRFSQLPNFQKRFSQFTSNTDRAQAVRRLQLTLAGEFDKDAFTDAVADELPKLVNATHACVVCFEPCMRTTRARRGLLRL